MPIRPATALMHAQQAMYDIERRQRDMLGVGLGGLGQSLTNQAISSGRSIEQERAVQWPHLPDGRINPEHYSPSFPYAKKKFTQTLREQLQTETDMWLSDI